MTRFQLDNISRWLLTATFLCLLLFTLSTPLYPVPLIGGRKFLTQLAFPLAVLSFFSLCVFYKRELRNFISNFSRNFGLVVSPFLPFIAGLVLIFLIYLPEKEQFVFKPSSLISYILFLSFIFAILRSSRQIKLQKDWLWKVSSVSIWITLILLCVISFEKGKSIFELREYIRPWVTVYSRCTALVSGICLFSIVYCNSKFEKVFYAVTGIVGFAIAAVILQTRSVLLSPFIAFGLLIFYFLSKKKINLKSIAIIFSIFFIVCSLSFISLSQRVIKGTEELASSGNFSEIQNVINKVEAAKPLSPSESQILSSLNTSMGGRMAAWATAANVSKEHFLFGTGEGHLSHFIDVKKIFKSSGNFVIHFHSDFVQVFVVGGVFLLLSLVLTQLFLLLQAIRRKNLVQLFLVTSMITFGIGEISFIETQTMLVFISAWVASFLLLDCKTSQE